MVERIQSQRLTLVPAARKSLAEYHRIWSDPQASFWRLAGTMKTREDSEILLDRLLAPSGKLDKMIWGVFSKDTHECIGMMILRLRSPHDPGAEEPETVWVLAYEFLPDHWGKGYATECVGAVIDAVGPVLQPCVFEAYINPANPPSAKVIGKVGFELAEKIYRPEEPRVFVGGEWREFDVWRYTRKI